jgi:hypothetical protein
MVHIANEKLKMYGLLDINKIVAELIQAGGKTLPSEICKLFDFICNKKEFPELWK